MVVSIIIPNWNGKKLLEKNLPFVLNACRKWRKTGWEVIVVDDASTDDSVSFLRKKYPQIKLVIHSQNQRFAAACNSGVKRAKGKVVVLLNNDVAPEPDFLKPLLKHFQNSQVFAVGCKEKDVQRGKVVYSGRGLMTFRRGLMVHWRAKEQDKKTTCWVTAGSGAYDRKKWLKIGGMDLLFRPAYEEDRDISYRAVKAGWKILFEPQSMVFHHHESTNLKTFGRWRMKIFSFKNQFLFVWKNITAKGLMLEHLLWLPYHLLVTNIKSHFLLGVGFVLALFQLPEAIRSRWQTRRFFVKSDREILQEYKSY